MQHYANLGNGQLLVDYGFTIPQNPDTTVNIPPEYFGIAPEDPWFDQKTELLEPLLSRYHIFFDSRNVIRKSELLITKTAISENLITAARIVVSSIDDFEDEEMTKLKKKASVTTEFELSRWFRGVIDHILSVLFGFANLIFQKYSTTLEDDEKYTKSSIFTGSSVRSQMAIEVRMEEKQILQSCEKLWARKQNAIFEAVKQLQQAEKEEL